MKKPWKRWRSASTSPNLHWRKRKKIEGIARCLGQPEETPLPKVTNSSWERSRKCRWTPWNCWRMPEKKQKSWYKSASRHSPRHPKLNSTHLTLDRGALGRGALGTGGPWKREIAAGSTPLGKGNLFTMVLSFLIGLPSCTGLRGPRNTLFLPSGWSRPPIFPAVGGSDLIDVWTVRIDSHSLSIALPSSPLSVCGSRQKQALVQILLQQQLATVFGKHACQQLGVSLAGWLLLLVV